MELFEIWEYMEREVFPIKSTPILFNMYNDQNREVDLPNADKIRRNNLLKYLESFHRKPPILIVAEAPGPWGARFSGVPLTTEEQLCVYKFPFAGKQSSKGGSPQPRGDVRLAQTARIFWSEMKPRHPQFLAWDALPFHPHKEGNPLSIRNPTKNELIRYSGLLQKVCSVINPNVTIALGKKAEDACKILNIQVKPVRHPAHGGKNKFQKQIREIFTEQFH
jgi:hypothetical protein